jgi:DNA-binding NtrC family response regulator
VPQDASVGQSTLAEIERLAIVQTLERTHGNKRAAASILGVYRPTLYGKIRKHKLDGYGKSATHKPKGSDSSQASGHVTDNAADDD